MTRIAQSPGGRGNFIAGRAKFQVQRSNYGQRLPFMSSTPVRDARSFKDTTGASLSFRYRKHPPYANSAASMTEIRGAEAGLQQAKNDVARIADRIREQQAVEQQHRERQNANEEARVSDGWLLPFPLDSHGVHPEEDRSTTIGI